MEAYRGFAGVYDELMDNVPYEAWAERVDRLIGKYGVSLPERDAEGILDSERNLVVDLGCGTGTLTELMYRKGYDMIGIDMSEAMLAEALVKKEKSGSEILYLQQDMRELELYSTVGTVISVCDSLNYILEEKELLTVFSLVNNYLFPGGIFIFDFNTVYKYREVIGDRVIAENREDCSFIWENFYDPEEELNEYDLTIFVREGDLFRRHTETHLQRGYTRERMKGLLEKAGLEVLEMRDADTDEPAGDRSERIYVVARERKKGLEDYLVRATAANAQIRAFACTTRGTVEKAREIHGSQPVVTAALGRLLSAGAMMGSMLKGDKDILTLQIKGDGPAQGLMVTADSCGTVKGYPEVPDVVLPANALGKLDVAGALGKGRLIVIKDMGLKEPYVGQTLLQTGEIAEDLTYYFAVSEQVPSSVGLGVLVNRDKTVRQAGGFIIQMMPFAEETVIDRLEQNLRKVSSVTALLDAGNTPEQMLEILLEGLEPEINDRMPVRYACNCSRQKIEKVLISLGRKEIRDMIEEGQETEVNCHFCNTHYKFSVEELKTILHHCK